MLMHGGIEKKKSGRMAIEEDATMKALRIGPAKQQGRIWSLFLSLLLVAGFSLFTACSDNPVSSPDQPSGSGIADVEQFNLVPPGDYDSDCFYGEGKVTPRKGGVVHLNVGKKINRLIVPRRSVMEPVVIDVTTCLYQERTNGERFIEFEFGPSDLTFLRGSYLVLDLKSLQRFLKTEVTEEGMLLKLFYYNPDTDSWEFERYGRIIGGRVIFRIDHFSKFGISD